jgi:hypothetical protein
MSRKSLLTSKTDEKKAQLNSINALIKKDVRFCEKKISDLNSELDEAKEALEARLSEEAGLDSSVVEVTFARIGALEAKIALYTDFYNNHVK